MIIKSFKLFESQIEDLCAQYNIKNYSINEDGSIDVDGSVDLSNLKLSKIPIKFGRVSDHFYCYSNQLANLEGAPSYVGGDFYCGFNNLSSLGAPNHVGGGFYCQYNQLASLEGAPSYVGGDFFCYNNQLASLEGAPSYVGGGFDFENNPIEEIYCLFDTSKCVDPINEYDVIQGNEVILSRLEEVYYELVMRIPSKFDFKYYKLID